MTNIKALLLATALVASVAGTANAVTVTNTDAKNQTIGIDWGNKEKVDAVAAGKSVTFECPDGCGVTGPWGFSWMAKGSDVATWNGESIVLSNSPKT